MPIVKTPGVLAGEPRLEGRRISVLQIADMVLDGGHQPEYVADQLDVPLAEVHEALAYYYNHPDEMDDLRAAHAEFEEKLRELSDAPKRAKR